VESSRYGLWARRAMMMMIMHMHMERAITRTTTTNIQVTCSMPAPSVSILPMDVTCRLLNNVSLFSQFISRSLTSARRSNVTQPSDSSKTDEDHSVNSFITRIIKYIYTP